MVGRKLEASWGGTAKSTKTASSGKTGNGLDTRRAVRKGLGAVIGAASPLEGLSTNHLVLKLDLRTFLKKIC